MPELGLVVLAAGVGLRYQGLKQVDSIGPNGESLLDYSLYGALQEGFKQVAFVIRREIQAVFRQSIGRYWDKKFATSYVFQELDSGLPAGFVVPAERKKPWGTGHAILISRLSVSTPFAVVNADDFYGRGAFGEMAKWLKRSALDGFPSDEYCLVGYRLRNTLSEHGPVSRGVCRVDPQSYLTEVVERVKIEKLNGGARFLGDDGRWVRLTGDEVVSMNFWGFTPTIFGHLEKEFLRFLERSGREPRAEYYIPVAVNELLRTGTIRVKHIPTADRWFGLTYPQDLPAARARIRELINEGVYPERIREEGGALC
jgi:dTDP-glucose pyrophosphorylase